MMEASVLVPGVRATQADNQPMAPSTSKGFVLQPPSPPSPGHACCRFDADRRKWSAADVEALMVCTCAARDDVLL